jgi:hypothetical protein
MNRGIAIYVLFFAGTLSTVGAQDSARPAVFTATQAEAGRSVVQSNSFGDCSTCHAENLAGRNGDAGERPALSSLPADYQKLVAGNGGKVPALIGPTFRTRWANRSTRHLTREFQERFAPPSGQLSEETRLNLIAYILQANGAAPGTEPLTMATDVPLRSLTPTP